MSRVLYVSSSPKTVPLRSSMDLKVNIHRKKTNSFLYHSIAICRPMTQPWLFGLGVSDTEV